MYGKEGISVSPLHEIMKREKLHSGVIVESKRAIMRREGCGSYNEAISKPQIVCTQKVSLKTLLSLILLKQTTVVKKQESRLL